MNEKSISIDQLNNGDKFKFANLENFRNTYIKRWSDCSTIIGGDVRSHKDDSWRPISPGFSISNQSQVIYLP